jgi:hypothetical protein
MSLSNLYFRGCFEPPSEEQKNSLGEIGIGTQVCNGTTIFVATTYNGLTVRGSFYYPASISTDPNVDVIILYHPSIDSQGVIPSNAALNFLNIVTNTSQINIKDKIIFSVAYPQDAIPAWLQNNSLINNEFPELLGNYGGSYANFKFGDNVEYAEAALLWVKNNINAYMSSNGIPKTINKVFTFGHSQGAYLVHRLNTMHPVDGVISNAPGPIDLLTRCSIEESQGDNNISCLKIKTSLGSTSESPESYNDVSLSNFLSGTLSPVLFTQALDDTTGNSAGTPQVANMQTIVQPGLEFCVNCAPVEFKYYATGGHAAFVTNTQLQEDIREFFDSTACLNSTIEIVDKSCARESINTCGVSIEELFDTYPIYNPQKGLYKSWGDIEFPWEIGNLTPNLLLSETNDKWKVATYRGVVAYPAGSRVLYIEDDGYRVSLYEANQDILAMSWAFDYSKWDKICHVETTIPAGTPSISEMLERFELYGLRLFDKEWGQYNAEWNAPLKETTLANCTAQGLSFIDFEKCVRNFSSDEWDKTRIRRDFFYREGDMFIVYGPCEDTLCLYIVTQDLPATLENLEQYKKFDLKAPFWQRFYCVNTGRNRCLEYQRIKTPELGYDVLAIGSKGHFVEMPAAYRISPTLLDLTDRTEQSLSPPPAILTQEEIDALPQPHTPQEES